MDDVELTALRVADRPKEGNRCLQLEIRPKNKLLAPAALERTFLAIHSPTVRLRPGTMVRLSAWGRILKPIEASADGAMLYDSVGGEPLAIRLLGPIQKWRQFTWYRTVPASGDLSVTLALTGLGAISFDDVRIEPLLPGQGTEPVGLETTLRSPKPPDS